MADTTRFTRDGPITIYSIRVDGLAPRADSLSYLIEKGCCYLSPNTKLADQGKAAQLVDQALADAFAAAALPIMRKRHGDQARLVVEDWSSAPAGSEMARLMARVRHDTSIVRARLREHNFAPNAAPLVIASDLE